MGSPLTRTPEHKAWAAAKQRCHNPRCKFYERYGGRGITMYEGWRQNFKAFLAHIGPRPAGKYTLDRINNDGNYEPGNVRWATWREQKLNSTSGPKRMDLTGQKFTRLTALSALPKRPLRGTNWLCRCDCGREVIVSLGHLRSGHTLSCGCLHRDLLRERARRNEPHLTAAHLRE